MTVDELADLLEPLLPRVSTWPPLSVDCTKPEERREAAVWLSKTISGLGWVPVADDPEIATQRNVDDPCLDGVELYDPWLGWVRRGQED